MSQQIMSVERKYFNMNRMGILESRSTRKKKTKDGLSSSFELQKRICELENSAVEIMQSEEQGEQKKDEDEQSLRDLQDIIKHTPCT